MPSLVSEWSSNPPAANPPAATASVSLGVQNGDVLTQMRVLISQMTPQQAQMAATVLNEQLGSQARGACVLVKPLCYSERLFAACVCKLSVQAIGLTL